MNRRNKGGKKNRKINRITELHVRTIENCLIMFAAINKEWWFTCTEITQLKNSLCQNRVTVCGKRPVSVYTDLVTRQTRRDP